MAKDEHLIISYGDQDENKICKHSGNPCHLAPEGCDECQIFRYPEAAPHTGPETTLQYYQQPLDLVTASGAAKILGWDRRQVNLYISRGRFPAPFTTLNRELAVATSRVWERATIEEFKRWRAEKKEAKRGDQP